MSDNSGDDALQSWLIAYRPDGSVTWFAHAIPASNDIHEKYTITAGFGNSSFDSMGTNLTLIESEASIRVDAGVIHISLPRSGSKIFGQIETASGKIVGQKRRLVPLSQSLDDDQDDST